MKMIQRVASLGSLLFLLSPAADASLVLTEVGSGNVVTPGPGSGVSVPISTLTINRSDPEFGNHTTAVEGVYYTYRFTAPNVDNGGSKSNFDVQHQMGGLWSGWGDALNGPWQNGPTTGTWARANRRQHVYTGGTPTSTFVSIPPGPDPTVPINTINQPDFGDLLQVSVYLYAVDNTLLTVFENLTDGESFQYLTTDPNLPAGNLSFTSIFFRSDSGMLPMNYTYGTLVGVPEPSTLFVLAPMGAFLLFRRRKRPFRFRASL